MAGRTERKDLRKRVERLHREATGATDGRGAVKWIADLGGVSSVSVSRMLTGDQEPDRLESILGLIEFGRSLGRRETETHAKLAKMSDERLLAKWNRSGDAKYADELARREGARELRAVGPNATED
jgi:hypothetical protein